MLLAPPNKRTASKSKRKASSSSNGSKKKGDKLNPDESDLFILKSILRYIGTHHYPQLSKEPSEKRKNKNKLYQQIVTDFSYEKSLGYVNHFLNMLMKLKKAVFIDVETYYNFYTEKYSEIQDLVTLKQLLKLSKNKDQYVWWDNKYLKLKHFLVIFSALKKREEAFEYYKKFKSFQGNIEKKKQQKAMENITQSQNIGQNQVFSNPNCKVAQLFTKQKNKDLTQSVDPYGIGIDSSLQQKQQQQQRQNKMLSNKQHEPRQGRRSISSQKRQTFKQDISSIKITVSQAAEEKIENFGKKSESQQISNILNDIANLKLNNSFQSQSDMNSSQDLDNGEEQETFDTEEFPEDFLAPEGSTIVDSQSISVSGLQQSNQLGYSTFCTQQQSKVQMVPSFGNVLNRSMSQIN